MNKKAVIGIVGGLAAGVIAVLLTHFYINKQEASIFQGMEMVEVLVVSKDLEVGTAITKNVLAKENIPAKYKHPNSVSLSDVNLVVGQTLNFPMKKDSQLLWTDLGEASEQMRVRGLSGTVTKGQRALAIPVDSVSGVSGLLQAGDHVDVLTTILNPQTGEVATITLLQNLTVLTAGGNASGGREAASSYKTVTLQVTLEEAEILVFSESKGRLVLIMRNKEDIETLKDIPNVNFSTILKDDYRKDIQIKRDNIEVIRQGRTNNE